VPNGLPLSFPRAGHVLEPEKQWFVPFPVSSRCGTTIRKLESGLSPSEIPDLQPCLGFCDPLPTPSQQFHAVRAWLAHQRCPGQTTPATGPVHQQGVALKHRVLDAELLEHDARLQPVCPADLAVGGFLLTNR